MMNDVGINISQLHNLLRRHKIGANCFEPESKIIDLCGEIIIPQFSEYNYIHELDSKPELILYWVSVFTTIFMKEITNLIYFKQLKVNEIFKIDLIVDGDYGQVSFRFPKNCCLL